jgi:hypothetical protein
MEGVKQYDTLPTLAQNGCNIVVDSGLSGTAQFTTTRLTHISQIEFSTALPDDCTPVGFDEIMENGGPSANPFPF